MTQCASLQIDPEMSREKMSAVTASWHLRPYYYYGPTECLGSNMSHAAAMTIIIDSCDSCAVSRPVKLPVALPTAPVDPCHCCSHIPSSTATAPIDFTTDPPVSELTFSTFAAGAKHRGYRAPGPPALQRRHVTAWGPPTDLPGAREAARAGTSRR